MSTKQLVSGSILTALTIIILYLTLLIPTNTLTLLTLASITVPIALIRENVKTSLMVYITSSLLGVILLPLNISLLYILFFGCYGIIKYFIEKLNRIPLEWLLKLIFFNIMFTLAYFLFDNLITPGAFAGLINLIHQLFPGLQLPPTVIIFVLAQIGFIIFDYAFTLLIDFYYTYCEQHIK
ncbi:hypothetical protein [Niameybacter massiliensis]|uniref:hypothetical protein n=1 Tax=Niameybacter massiliensis TaxID=1658108 RepID=UPI0006B4915E|nr:hypothetical protein [Niameybacter massiliensis]